MKKSRTGERIAARRMGERFERGDALELLREMPMGRLMAMAHGARLDRYPEPAVTFVIDTNPNYTNICVTRCLFCAFCRPGNDADAYTLSPKQLGERVKAAHDIGATTVLLQGGHNPAIGLGEWTAYIREIRKACPDIHIHPFSPAEYVFMAAKEKISYEEALRSVYLEGVDTIPGGGAEILTERVRQAIAPDKATTNEWLELSETAHRIGFRTTATMMFGHIETDMDIVDHLLSLRAVQDRTGGFTSFIPWSFKPGCSHLSRKVPSPVHPAKYVRIIALARLVLDNFPHIQSSWFSESVQAGQLGLLAGADDFGGVLIEENVLKTTGYRNTSTVEEVKNIIRRAGFTPAQRNGYYQTICVQKPV
ncbi:MAG: CofH family radical SAM protein [bacterium]|nr:CofH family radical SAM protein [bacterium]MDT8396276.1 CofH family radical SAM protein [bacterium]